jgi:MoxR-like ATPase
MFMMNIHLDYPTEDEEYQSWKRGKAVDTEPDIHWTPEDILTAQQMVLRVPCTESVVRYAVRLVRSTRPETEYAPSFVKEYVSRGVSPQAVEHLILAARARCLIHGRFVASFPDIQELALPVLRHRIESNFSAEAEGIKKDNIIRRLLETLRPD